MPGVVRRSREEELVEQRVDDGLRGGMLYALENLIRVAWLALSDISLGVAHEHVIEDRRVERPPAEFDWRSEPGEGEPLGGP